MKVKEILNLRNETRDQRRGLLFEQYFRDLVPTDDNKPAQSVKTDEGEQFDAVWRWKNQIYIAECKAKKEPIRAASHDWEDFALKIRSRDKHSVIYVFCPLFPIHSSIHDKAKDLVKNGSFVIILEGQFWDDLYKSCLSITDVLDYMSFFGVARLSTTPPKLSVIEKWKYDITHISQEFTKISLHYSSEMHRRFKFPDHEDIYVTRDIDKQIKQIVRELSPRAMKKDKEPPIQICLIRDYSGSGKTTSSIHMSLINDTYIGVGMTANEESIYEKFKSFFEYLGKEDGDYGIKKLIRIKKPIVYVVDSLDEASGLPGKKEEVKSIINFIDNPNKKSNEFDLNKKAREYDLLVYPVLVVFTIREDYWRDWEAIFEGRNKRELLKQLTCYNDKEFDIALKKHMDYYGYTITNRLSAESKEVLSRPINLSIFSQTNHHVGQINVSEIWECSVLSNFFKRKLDNMEKRCIPNFRATVFMNLLSEIAYAVISNRNPIIENAIISRIIDNQYRIYSPFYDEIIQVFLSELILVKDKVDMSGFRFRYLRFLDYLMAYYCLYTVSKYNSIRLLDQLLKTIYDSNIVLMFNIHEDMVYICKEKYPELTEKLNDYYSVNEFYMTHKISGLRCDLAMNIKINNDDIELILRNISRRNPKLMVEAFFVIAAKPCEQSDNVIINTFVSAFKAGDNISGQYKMIKKLTNKGLLCNEKVLRCLLLSDFPRNWETYLGGIIETMGGNYNRFVNLWKQVEGIVILDNLMNQSPSEDWSQVQKLLDIILTGKKYILGDVSVCN